MIVDAAALRIEPALAAVRKGELSSDLALEVREAAEAHGVWLPLAHQALGRGGREGPAAHVLWRALREAAARDALQQAEGRRVIRGMASAGVDALILKGAHLSTVLYQPSHLRPRADLDLLVSPAEQARGREALTALGYQPAVLVQREAVFAQLAFERLEAGVRHVVDLHWRALNPHPFRGLLPFEAIRRRRVAVPALGPEAWGLCGPDALLHAVAHLAAHHGRAPRLMWVADVDRLARRLCESEWRAFTEQACAAGLAGVGLAVFRVATRFFATAVPREVEAALRAAAPNGRLSEAFLEPRSQAALLWLELRALRRWRDRGTLVVQHLVPDRRYMRERYGVQGGWLVWAYARRAAGGARQWLKGPEV
jgi:hypothetical protein